MLDYTIITQVHVLDPPSLVTPRHRWYYMPTREVLQQQLLCPMPCLGGWAAGAETRRSSSVRYCQCPMAYAPERRRTHNEERHDCDRLARLLLLFDCALTSHANLEVGWSGRCSLLLWGLCEPCLYGKDNSNPAADQKRSDTRRTTLTIRSSCRAHVMSVMLCLHSFGNTILVAGEDLGRISAVSATWGQNGTHSRHWQGAGHCA